MTTQVPYGPDAQSPDPNQQFVQPSYPQPPAAGGPAYPPAPPWATPPAAAAESPPPGYGAVAPYGAPYPEHGQLLVPFPEEMQNAARPKPPSVWPIAPFTFFLAIPGLLSTVRRAGQARRGRNSTAPYWITFAVSLVASFVVWWVVAAVAVPVGLDYLEGRVTSKVEHKIVHDGQIEKSSGVTVTTAQCEPSAPRAAGGDRPYECLLTLGDGRTGALDVTADSDGNWTAVPETPATTKPATKTKK